MDLVLCMETAPLYAESSVSYALELNSESSWPCSTFLY